jgi:hypothetical protein
MFWLKLPRDSPYFLTFPELSHRDLIGLLPVLVGNVDQQPERRA